MSSVKLWGLEHSWSTWSIIHSNKNQIKHSEVENSPAFATCCVVPTKAPKNTSWAFIEGSFHKLETIYGLWPHPEFEPLNDHQTRWISGSLENTVTTICGQASQPLLLAVHLQTFWPTPLQLELATGTPDRVGAPNWKISLSDDSNKGLDHLRTISEEVIKSSKCAKSASTTIPSLWSMIHGCKRSLPRTCLAILLGYGCETCETSHAEMQTRQQLLWIPS